MDPQDVGAGYVTRMRWRHEETWVRPSGATRPALVSKDLFSIARGRMASSAPSVSRANAPNGPTNCAGYWCAATVADACREPGGPTAMTALPDASSTGARCATHEPCQPS